MDPIARFRRWLEEATRAGIDEPGAMTLATAGRAGRPSARIVALRGLDARGFVFYSHEASQKGRELAQNPRVIGFGEIGLDYYYDHSPREVQQQVFIRQMDIARTAKMPIIIHCRPSDKSENAWEETLQLIREHWASSGLGGVLHCFTGEQKHANAALDMGFMISFAGNVTFPKAENIREAARQIPQDRMFIETDSPFLAPIPYRGKRNEPAYVAMTAAKIAELRNLTPEEVGSITSDNFFRFFRLKTDN